MASLEQRPSQAGILERLRSGRVGLRPLSLRLLRAGPRLADGRRLSALVEGAWDRSKVRFAAECRSLSTPKAFAEAVALLRTSALPTGCVPLLVVPFLSDEQLERLEEQGVCGIDLCGNGVVRVAGRFAVARSGKPNRFSSSAPIKNVYRGATSMVARLLLACPAFGAVKDVVAEVRRRDTLAQTRARPFLAFGTVSKALAAMEQDLVVGRHAGVRLLQPDALLERLARSYRAPACPEPVRLKVPLEGPALYRFLGGQAQSLGAAVAATGLSSVNRYATMQRGDVLRVYCSRAAGLVCVLGVPRAERFPNLEVVETADPTVYFDARQDEGLRWASPVQTYLELMAGDKRDQETAAQVQAGITAQAGSTGQ